MTFDPYSRMLVPEDSLYVFMNHNFSILPVFALVTRYGTASVVLDELAKEVVPYHELDTEAIVWLLFTERLEKYRLDV